VASDFGAHTERSLAARLLPSPPLHNHPHDHADHLPQALRPARMLCAEEPIDRFERFELAHNPRQGRTVVVDFGVLHALLALAVAKELKDLIKGLFRVIEHVREGSALSVLEKVFSSDQDLRHRAPLGSLEIHRKVELPAL
jgi:hypothetical protein